METISHINQLPGSFISLNLLTSFREDEALDVAKSIAPAISQLLSGFPGSLDALFHPDAFWRDHVSLSWSLRTFHPTSVISAKIIPLIQRAEIITSSILLQEEQVLAIAFPNGVSVVRVPFTFRTANPKAQCTAAFKLIRMKTGEVKVFTVTTAIQELDAVPWGKFDDPLDLPPAVPTSLDVLVVGGGHGGLSISAYLKALGINFAMVEKETTIGDSWAKAYPQRYDSTTLHTTRMFSGLPYIPFPSDYPQYVPAKLIAQYYAEYAQELQLPTYHGRECIAATWDEQQAQWIVTLEGLHGVEIVSARIIVFAVGIAGRIPVFPSFPGMDSFLGESLHSAAYKDASLWAGRRVGIVGSSTTACDVANDCVRAGADVVIIQRGPTRIYPGEHITTIQALFWNEQIPVEVGDVMATEDPIVLQAALSELVLGRLKDSHECYYNGLRRAGFLATVEGSVQQQIFIRSGGHYPDVGACGAIARGEIKVKSEAKIESITPTGIAFSDGTKLDVDVIVYATGSKDARNAVAPILGAELAASLEPIWGLDAEGEVRGCWRPTGNDHIWFQGGDLQTMRYFGKVNVVRPIGLR
ncbi:hypothetical protein B0H11DRAFT_1704238 [Mycena galericulata]|nr:hypothetical protein B0H11DRAFT_1704238 [Mycena galericulata]